ncbi:MAG: hypothetical protein AB8B52_05910 [Winogradskyella sp.]|uniref:hypothetical protein n=1 Tax=Winogradskyella sp. TaxID=1883156 RepID=UPI0038590CAA
MKNIYKFLILTVVTVFLVGCDEELVAIDNNTFVQLKDGSPISLPENSGQVVSITAQLGSPQTVDVTIDFEADGDASRYALSSGSIVILAGETEGIVEFTPIDDDEINGDVDITVAISSSSDLPVGIAGLGSGASQVITIVDDNVPCNNFVLTFVTDRWGSEIIWDIVDASGAVVATGGPYTDLAANGDTFTDEANIPLEDGCYTFRAFDWYGDGYSAGGASYELSCGALSAGIGDGALDGIPGLDISTVPVNSLYGSQFRGASATSGAAPFANHAESFDFCVNQ